MIGTFSTMALALCAFCATALGQRAREPASSSDGSAINVPDAALLAKALAACDRGEGAAVRTDLERLAGKYPGNFAANEALGIVEVEAGEYARAVIPLERAAAAAKTNAAAQANLGAAYLEAGDSARAVKVLRRAAALDGKNAATFAGLGKALCQDNAAFHGGVPRTCAHRVEPG